MERDQIPAGLNKIFAEGHRIVFWHDPEGEFEETIASLTLDGTILLRLDEVPALETKIRVEKKDPTGRFLLYAPFPEPAPEGDWLLDIRLYSRSFRADRASIILDELGLTQQHLRQHLAQRSKFFANKERLARLKKLVTPTDDAIDIDRKIMAVLTRVDQPDFFNILISLYHVIPDGSLDQVPPSWEEFGKFGVAETFWKLVQMHFGYTEAQPGLKNFLIRLLVTDFAQSCLGDIPTPLQHLMLPSQGQANAVVLVGQWRDSSTRNSSFDNLSAGVAEAIRLSDHLGGLDIDDLLDVKTFLLVEQFIASGLRDRVIDTADAINADAIRDIASHRQDGHWATNQLPSTSSAPRAALHAIYDALVAAADLFALRSECSGGFTYGSAKDMYDAYTGELFRFDQLYRHFSEAVEIADGDWDILKTLGSRVEEAYGNGFLTNLALRWGEHLEGGFLKSWRIDDIPNQQRFFQRKIQEQVLDKADDRRVFVIISDAFRYEAACELTELLQGTYRFTAKLSSQLGVLPSYTSLGMAALLPHKELAYTDSGSVVLDGQSTASLDYRSKILGKVKGVAVKADDIMAMKKEDGRAFVKPYRVIYIYHNQVDAVGDSASTEGGTFSAVRKSIKDIEALVTRIMNSLSGNHIVITADHGFLYQRRTPTETDKNALGNKPAGTILAKKRYLLGKGLPDNDKAFHGSTAVTAGASGDMEFWVPKGVNRFHFVGGSRFIHGGAMLQEITVPVITVKLIKGESVAKTQTRQVGVSVLGTNHKITTNRHRFQIIQTDKVSERVKPLVLKIAVYEGEQLVTNMETVTMDSSSNDIDERKKSVSLTLQSRTYNKGKLYHLGLRNAETGVEEARIGVIIDLAFTNDF